MKILENIFQYIVIAGKFKLIAWEFDPRLFKKISMLSLEILKKNGIEPVSTDISHIEWPHISAALVSDATPQEVHKVKLAGSVLKPDFKVKHLAMFSGQKIDYLAVEFDVPKKFLEFFGFVSEIFGDRHSSYNEHRPHASIWGFKKEDSAKVEKLIPEITQAVKKYLQPFTPSQLNFWDDFHISEIEAIGLFGEYFFIRQVGTKYNVVATEDEEADAADRNFDINMSALKRDSGNFPDEREMNDAFGLGADERIAKRGKLNIQENKSPSKPPLGYPTQKEIGLKTLSKYEGKSMFLKKVKKTSFLKKVAKVVAKTNYLEEQLTLMKDKLAMFIKAKPDILASITKSKMEPDEKIKERKVTDSVQHYLEMSVGDLKKAIEWRDKEHVDINNEKDLKLAPSGAKLLKNKIPSFNLLPGVTCPNKDKCFGWCYAMGGNPLAWKLPDSAARAMQMRSLGLAERDDWVDRMNERLKKIPNKKPFRIHVTGDFYHPDYIKKWVQVAKDNPDRKFYAYTKSHQMAGMEELESQPNVTIRYSYGGTDDEKIDPKKHLHCKVFETSEELKKAGYTECGHESDDTMAADKSIKKLGIVKHGTRKYEPKMIKPEVHASTSQYPVAHLYDQIDAPHNWDEEEHEHNDHAYKTSDQLSQHRKLP